MIGVLLVEDHASYRQALEAVLSLTDDVEVVGQAGRGDQAGVLALALAPDVALVDLDLPGSSGIEAITAIRAASPTTACVVLTALTDDVELGRAVEAGAAAVLHKSVDLGELVEVVRAVAQGATLLPVAETSVRLRALAAARDAGWHARVLNDAISPREREILGQLTQGRGNAEIAKRLGIATDTVATHVRNLLAKLGVNSRLEAVAKALRLGLVEPPHQQRLPGNE